MAIKTNSMINESVVLTATAWIEENPSSVSGLRKSEIQPQSTPAARTQKEDEVFDIYLHYVRVIDSMQNSGIDQWDELYPNSADIAADISEGILWVGEEEGRLLCTFAVGIFNSSVYGKEIRSKTQRYGRLLGF